MNCIRRFFRKRFRFEAETWPVWADVLEEERLADEAERAAKAKAEAGDSEVQSAEGTDAAHAGSDGNETGGEEEVPVRLRLDLEVEASGFGRAMQRELEDVSHATLMRRVKADEYSTW